MRSCAYDIQGNAVPARFLQYLRDKSKSKFEEHLKKYNKAAKTSLYQTTFGQQNHIWSARLYLENTLRAADNIPLDVAVHDQSSEERAMI